MPIYYRGTKISNFNSYVNLDGANVYFENGSPQGVVSTIGELPVEGSTGIYVVTTTGHWYYFSDTNNGEWIDGGTYQATEITDGGITTAKIADNAITSDKIADNAVTEAKISNDVTSRLNVTKNTITVDIGGTGDYTTITSAITSITDSSATNVYDIFIKAGTYEEYSLTLPDYVNLVGENRDTTIIQGALPNTATDAQNRSISTIDMKRNNNLSNLTVTARNMRYVVHDESAGEITDWVQLIDNCYFEHFGNQDLIDYRIANGQAYNNVWSGWTCWGEGASSGAYAKFTHCTFKTVDGYTNWSVHEAVAQAKPYLHEIEDCEFIGNTSGVSINLSEARDSGHTDNTVIVKNSKINGSVEVLQSGAYKAKMLISGCGRVPYKTKTWAKFIDGTIPVYLDYDKFLKYEGTGTISTGEFVQYGSTLNSCIKANHTTDPSLVIGYAVCNGATTGTVIQVMDKAFLYTSSLATAVQTVPQGTKYRISNACRYEATTEGDEVAIAVQDNVIKWIK